MKLKLKTLGAVVEVVHIETEHGRGRIDFTCDVLEHGKYHFSLEENDAVIEHLDIDESSGRILPPRCQNDC